MAISFTPLYHFQPLLRHLDISQAITAESSPLHIASSWIRTGKPMVSERKSLTTKLRVMYFSKFTGKHLCRSLLEAPTQVFSCEFCEIFKNILFREHLLCLLLVISKYGFM